ncbi:DUF397 domain-containing protein [Nocardiopsis potens]|uniref:DUF397 domain-containing protein n=1 Tax=Nocardiopsis potens TaxID=1246458 RepID=UPI00035C1888|nr:DUF397 domain-containing protein [Nocardiopsis potens]
MLDETWRKSSRSQVRGDCVEASLKGPVVSIRDSRNPGQPPVALSREAWVALLASLRG